MGLWLFFIASPNYFRWEVTVTVSARVVFRCCFLLPSRAEEEMRPWAEYFRFRPIYGAKSKQKACACCVRVCPWLWCVSMSVRAYIFLCEIVNDVTMEERILIVRQITMRAAYSCPPHTHTHVHTHTYSHTHSIIIVTEGARLIIGQRCL